MHGFKFCLCPLPHSLNMIGGDTQCVDLQNRREWLTVWWLYPIFWKLLYALHWLLYMVVPMGHPFLYYRQQCISITCIYWYEEFFFCIWVITSKYPLLRNSSPRTIIVFSSAQNNFNLMSYIFREVLIKKHVTLCSLIPIIMIIYSILKKPSFFIFKKIIKK